MTDGQATPRSILVVDDKEDICEVLALLLRSRGHTVEIAHDGPAALNIVAGFSPDFALVDLHLPRMDGYELARRLRARFDPLLLVAMTASPDGADGTKARAALFDEHLPKPIDWDHLWSILAKH
jgi:CheY-like chemotaxis protein